MEGASRRAVVVYGRVGTYQHRAGVLSTGASGEATLWQACARTAAEHVLKPWRENGAQVDVFVQSWNPELADAMDSFWKPAASDHSNQSRLPASAATCPIRMKLCERTMWALLGLKRALVLRTKWEASHPSRARAHVAVLAMRHDVYWRAPFPPLRADGFTRLWLPFECQVNYCRDPTGRNTSTCFGRRIPDGSAGPPEWLVMKHSQSTYFGRKCDRDSLGRNPQNVPLCANTVLIDWWFVSSTELADGFAETYDEFGRYSSEIQARLGLNLSAPHQYWGLYFFHKHGLREKCQLGFSRMHGFDFTLGRFIPEGVDARSTCSYPRNEQWRPLWRPPAACDAAAIPGYMTMCPEVPSRAIHYVCRDDQHD